MRFFRPRLLDFSWMLVRSPINWNTDDVAPLTTSEREAVEALRGQVVNVARAATATADVATGAGWSRSRMPG
jgi:hypothetical protein